MNYVFAFALGIGFVAGLRALTPPAVVAWAAHLGWLHLNNSPLAFVGSTIAVIIFSLLDQRFNVLNCTPIVRETD